MTTIYETAEQGESRRVSLSSIYQSATEKFRSIMDSSTAQKVSSYIQEAGTFIKNASSYSITKLSSFYGRLTRKINQLSECGPIMVVSAIALAYFFPLPTLIGGAIGFATNNNEYEFEALDQMIHKSHLSNKTLTAIGALAAVAMPVCTLSTLAIYAGTIGLGRTVDEASL